MNPQMCMGLGELKLDYTNVWKEKGTPSWYSGFFKHLDGTCTVQLTLRDAWFGTTFTIHGAA